MDRCLISLASLAVFPMFLPLIKKVGRGGVVLFSSMVVIIDELFLFVVRIEVSFTVTF